MNVDLARMIVRSMRANIAALDEQLSTLELTLGKPEPVQRGCAHTGERENQGTFGAPDWHCVACGASVEAPA